MANRQLDPTHLQGEALQHWFRRSPEDVDRERQAEAAKRYRAFFGHGRHADPDPGISLELDPSARNVDPGFRVGLAEPHRHIDPGFALTPGGPHRGRIGGPANPNGRSTAIPMPNLYPGLGGPGSHPVPMPEPWRNWERTGPGPVPMPHTSLRGMRRGPAGGAPRTSGEVPRLSSSTTGQTPLPVTAPLQAGPNAGRPEGRGGHPGKANAPPRPDPRRTEVYQPGPDGKLHPVPGWHTTGPFDFGTWSHNINWGGVGRDLGNIANGVLNVMTLRGAASGLLEALGPKVEPAAAQAIKEVIHGHHPMPKFMGGRGEQELVDLYKSLHEKFHATLAAELKEAGLPPVGGKTGSTVEWLKHFELNPGTRERAVEILRKATRDFDQEHGTSILPALEKELGTPPPKIPPPPK